MPQHESATPARRRLPEDILRTAERLIATHGIDGVSLRQIAVESGHRNPGAVQYHFGSKAGLLAAIMEYRLPGINRRRLQLLDRLRREGREGDVRRLVDVMVRPLLEMDPEAYFVELEARLSPLDELHEAYLSTGPHADGSRRLLGLLHDALADHPPLIRENRIRMASDLLLNAIANRRVQEQRDAPLALSDARFAQDLSNAMVGLLLAPDAPEPAADASAGRSERQSDG
jgi:AcrR family transcriptional regulator